MNTKSNNANKLKKVFVKQLENLAVSLNFNSNDINLIKKLNKIDAISNKDALRLYSIFEFLLQKILYVSIYSRNAKKNQMRIDYGLVFSKHNYYFSSLIHSINKLLMLLNQIIDIDSISNDNIRTMRFMVYLSEIFSRVIMNTSKNKQDAKIPKTKNSHFLDKNGNEIEDEELINMVNSTIDRLPKNNDIKIDFLCENMEFKHIAFDSLNPSPSRILNKKIQFSLHDTKNKESKDLPAYDGFSFNSYHKRSYDLFWMFCTCDKETCNIINNQITNLQNIITSLMEIDKRYKLEDYFRNNHTGIKCIYSRTSVGFLLWMAGYNSKWFINNNGKWTTNSFFEDSVDEQEYITLQDALPNVFNLESELIDKSFKLFISNFISSWLAQIQIRADFKPNMNKNDVRKIIFSILNVVYTAIGKKVFIENLDWIISQFVVLKYKRIACEIIIDELAIDSKNLPKTAPKIK